MSDIDRVARTNDLGVVDPIGMPGPMASAISGVRTAWLRLPTLGRAFLALAVLDVLIRGLGLFGTSLFIDLSVPLSVVSAFVPHSALILLPSMLLLRRHDAASATPLVVRGAVFVALAELLNAPLRGLTSGNALDPMLGPTLIAIAATVVTAIGWVLVARGMQALAAGPPDQQVAGLANVVGGGLALGAIVSLAGVLLLPAADIGDPTWNMLVQANSAFFVVQALAFAYLARVVVRGTNDERRPARARVAAAAGLILFAIGAILTTAFSIVTLAQVAFFQATPSFDGTPWVVIAWLTGPVAMTLLVASFGLGLADPSDGRASDTIAG